MLTKTIMLLTLIIIFTAQFAMGQSTLPINGLSESPALVNQRRHILENRVRLVLRYRLEGLTQCAYSTDNNQVTELLSRQPSIESSVYDLMSYYQETEKLKPNCSKYYSLWDGRLKSLERKEFDWVSGVLGGLCYQFPSPISGDCIASTTLLWLDIDPHCYTEVVEDLDGFKEPHPCFAADHLIAKTIHDVTDPDQKVMSDFLNELTSVVNRTSAGDRVYPWDIYRKHNGSTYKSKLRFLGMMTMLYGANSSSSGYMDGFGDHYWVEGLKGGLSVETTIQSYVNLRRLRDQYEVLNRRIQGKYLSVMVNGMDLMSANHHNYVAAFLACKYRGKGWLFAHILPRLLGVAYESKDLIAHKQGGASWADAIQNFKVDTDRYYKGSNLGYSFCAQ